MRTIRYPRRRGYISHYRAGRINRRETSTAWADRMIKLDGQTRTAAFRQGLVVAHAAGHMSDPVGRYGRPGTNTPEFDEYQAGYDRAQELLVQHP
ncbi:hypothetical protein [Pigmentiphaga daeguensis]|uniref:Uncharacterized protein n=1 Tax=Pigmentiphaga daeguensis TaxID=414049 RepID=A0ABP3LAZ0_9BURK